MLMEIRMRRQITMAIMGLLVALLAPTAAIAQAPSAAWRIVDERVLDVEAEYVTLSPDGQWIAGMGPGESICVWEVATLTSTCAGEGLPIRAETVTWSPDGSAVAFALDAAFLGWESDIYVFERESGELWNLTDDGLEGDLFSDELVEKNPPLDDVPVWSTDGERLAFVRSHGEGEIQSTAIMVIDRAGGEPVELVALDVEAPHAVWTPMFWLADDSLVYSVNALDLADSDNGVWRVGVDDGSSPAQVIPGGAGADIPAALVVDVVGDEAVVYSWSLMRNYPREGGVTAFWSVDLASGERMPLPEPPSEPDMLFARRVIDASFSPDGGTMLVVTDASQGPLLMTMDVATGTLVPLDGAPRNGAILPVTPQWATNDTVLFHTWDGPVLLALEPGA
jgi:hypothetical protein